MASRKADIVVIGGGHNGLVAATALARSGKKVVVLEAASQFGGLCAGGEVTEGHRHAGFWHDTTGFRPRVIAELELEKHGLKLRSSPQPTLALGDGASLLLTGDPTKDSSAVADLCKPDAEALPRFYAFLDEIRPVVQRVVDAPPPDLTSDDTSEIFKLAGTGLAVRRLGGPRMMDLLRIGPMAIRDWLDDWFETPILKAALACRALMGTWLGPWSAGTTAAYLMATVTKAPGVVGGPAALVTALEAAARSAGVELVHDAAVRRINVADGKVVGVTTADDTIEAPTVVSSCDPRQTLLDLVHPRQLPADLAAEAQQIRVRGTTSALHFAVSALSAPNGHEELVPNLTVGGSLAALEKSFDAVKYGQIPTAPHLQVTIPTLERPELAPTGHHVVSVLVHGTPYDLDDGWNDEANRRLRDVVVQTLEQHFEGFADGIVGERVDSPADLARDLRLTGGHVHHGEHALDQLLFMRPTPSCARYRTPVEGLYLAGAGSHPGGGITGMPGLLGADAVLGR